MSTSEECGRPLSRQSSATFRLGSSGHSCILVFRVWSVGRVVYVRPALASLAYLLLHVIVVLY